MTNRNGWKVREVEAAIAPPPVERQGRWLALYRELCLRLEQTPSRLALAVEFDTYVDTKLAYDSLRRRFDGQHGPGFAELATRRHADGSGVLYVRRGETWGK